MEIFIENVKKYPCLWKTDIEEYKLTEIKEAAWRNVVKQCDLPDVKEAKSLWKKLRDGHRQVLNKRKTTTGQSASNDKPWKFEKLMEFLIPCVTNRPRSTNAVINVDDSQRNISKSSSENDDDDERDENKSQTKAIPARGKRKRGKNDIMNFLENQQKQRTERSAERDRFRKEVLMTEDNPGKKGTIRLFFEGMSEMCESLPDHLQIKVQRVVFNSIMYAREENLRQNQYLSSASMSFPLQRTRTSLPAMSPHLRPESSHSTNSQSVYSPPLSGVASPPTPEGLISEQFTLRSFIKDQATYVDLQ